MSARAEIGFVVDLDDTLYPQADYLDGASVAVGKRGEQLGLNAHALQRALREVLREGSDRGFTIDEALLRCGIAREPTLVEHLVEAFVSYQPISLRCYEGVEEGLIELRARGPLACLTDGREVIQRAKIAALGLEDAFDLIVITDEIGGRKARKPNSVGLYWIAGEFSMPVTNLVVIGDRPDKDVAMAKKCGVRALRIRQGEYARQPSLGWERTVSSFSEALDLALHGDALLREHSRMASCCSPSDEAIDSPDLNHVRNQELESWPPSGLSSNPSIESTSLA